MLVFSRRVYLLLTLLVVGSSVLVSSAYAAPVSHPAFHYATLSTDKAQYQIGDTVQVCFSITDPGHATVTLTEPDGSQRVVFDQDVTFPPTQHCFSGQAGPPPGQRQLHLDESFSDGFPDITADTTFQVVAQTGPCGTTLGQHCDAIWTDKSQYLIGETIQYCYSLAGPAYIQITDTDASGNSQVVANGNDDGTGGCSTGTITPPTGTETLTMQVQGNTFTDTVSTSFQVLGSGCAPTCQARLTTDKSQYNVGDAVQICFNPYVPSHVRITNTLPDGTQSVLYDQDDDGTGGCLTGQAGLPTGTRHLHMDVTQGGQVIAQADASFRVVASKPGGVWISPRDGSTTSGIVTFSAHAYPANSGEAPIDHVNFTVWWPALGPQSGPWRTACISNSSTGGDVYTCTADLSALGIPPGQVLVSFDVYDQVGNSNLSPNGEHTIYYSPPATPTPTPVPPSIPTPTNTPVPPPTYTPTSTPIPTSTPLPPQPSNTPTLEPVPSHKHRTTRFIMFIPGICFSLLERGPCTNHGDGRIDSNWRAWDTFQALIHKLDPWAHKNHVNYEYYSYWIRADAAHRDHPRWYYPSDTHQPLAQSAWQLNQQLRTLIPSASTQATVDLVGHSLGGAVAAYWATQVDTYGDPWMLKKVHALITMDSPLQGNLYAYSKAVNPGSTLAADIFTGVAGSDLDPWNAVQTIRDPARGLTTELPHRVFTVINLVDVVVPAPEAWVAGAVANKLIKSCWDNIKGTFDGLEGCHGAVLSDPTAVDMASRWIE